MNRIAQATPTSTSATDQIGPRRPGVVYVDVDFGGLMAARRADHNAHCTCCRELTAASDAAAAENGASIQRRDRRQLDLPFSRHTRAVSV